MTDKTVPDSIEALPLPELRQTPNAVSSRPTVFRRVAALGAAALLLGLGIYTYVVSREPEMFDPRQAALELTAGATENVIPGVTVIASSIRTAETLLNKPGGYLRNDIAPPTLLLDNMPSWERGALRELRDVVQALRNDFGRAQTQSTEDPDLMVADAQFHFDPDHWVLPSTEDEYVKGVTALRSYLSRLIDEDATDARFFARADNLNFYLAKVEKRLGNLSQRLSASVREPWMKSVQGEQSSAPESTLASPFLATSAVSWWQADDVFYEARGFIWALVHTLRAIEVDFADILRSKEAALPLHEIIVKLQRAQQKVWSPVIMNNTGFGMFTNHCLVLASYISRANAAIIDLRLLLSEG